MYKFKLKDCIKEVIEKTTENNQYEVLSVTKDGIFSQEEFFNKQIASENNVGYKIIKKDNLVFSTMNLWMGSLDVLDNYDIGIVSPAYKIFEFDKEKMIPAFGKYFMKSYRMLERYKECSEQGASIVRRNLDLKQLLDTEIEIPSVMEQKKIVEILEKNDQIIEKYGELIEEKDQFIKSQFVEMFEKEFYKDILLGEEFIINSGGTPDKKIKEYWEPKEISWIGSNLCRDKLLYQNDGKYISTEGLKHSSAKIFKSDTVLVALVGATIGKTALLKFETTTNQNIAGIECNDDFNSEYVFYAIQNLYNDFVKLNVGNFKMANLSFIRNLRIKKPPIELQNRFANLVQLIDKQKFIYERLINNYKKYIKFNFRGQIK